MKTNIENISEQASKNPPPTQIPSQTPKRPASSTSSTSPLLIHQTLITKLAALHLKSTRKFNNLRSNSVRQTTRFRESSPTTIKKTKKIKFIRTDYIKTGSNT
ncbi:unnamed protein product [Macrosiphum euphorbiae]|nr:unnamed protein product [Macrosiphum euphorbiae]